MKKQIMYEKMYASKYFPLILTSCFYMLFYLCVKRMGGDDVHYYPKAHDGTLLLDFLKMRYAAWSSRVFIEGMMILVLRLPFVVWKLLTGLLVSGLLWIIYYLFFSKERPIVIWILCASFVLCNFYMLSTSAGWVATTLNYIWPVSALFSLFIPIKMIETDGKTNKPHYLLFIPVMFFTANQEQYCVIILLVSSLFLAITLKQKRHIYYYYLLFAVSLASLLFILSSPGNTARFAAEINNWYPRFGELSLLQKAAIGIMTLFNWIVITNPWLFLLSSLVIVLILYFDENEKLIYRIISLIPLGGSVFAFVMNFLAGHLPGFLKKADRLVVDNRFGGLIQGEQYHTIPGVLKIAFIISVSITFLLCIYIIFKNTKRALLLLLTILSGFISQLVLSFSPTVYASSIRTATLLFISLAIITTSLFSYYSETRDMKKTAMVSLSLAFAVIVFANMTIQIMNVWRA